MDNNTNTSDVDSLGFIDLCPLDSQAQRLAKLISFGVLFVISLVGNFIVCLIVYKNRKMRTTINYLLVNMSVSDLTVPLLVITRKFFEISTNNLSWRIGGLLGIIMCKVVYYISDITPIVSILSLIMITYDRFSAIVLPHKAAKFPSQYRTYFIALTWTLACIFCSPYFYFLGIKPTDQGDFCTMLWSHEIRRAYTVPLTILFIIVPFLLLVVLYSCILYKVKRQPSNLCQTERGKRRSQVSKRVTTILSFTVVTAFAVCWGPYFTILMLSNFQWNWNYDFCSYEHFIFTVQFLAYSNSAVNPVFYFLFLRNFRRGLGKLLGINTCKKRNGTLRIEEKRQKARNGVTRV